MSQDLKFIAERMVKWANRKRSKGPDLIEGGVVYLLRKNIKTKRPSDKLDHTKLGPFKIEKKLGLVIYKLQLPEGMRIYPVFYVSLLEEVYTRQQLGPIYIDKES